MQVGTEVELVAFLPIVTELMPSVTKMFALRLVLGRHEVGISAG